jgi:hypothetical protein
MARTAYRRRPPRAVAAEVATHQSLWNLRPQYERAPAVRVGHGILRRYCQCRRSNSPAASKSLAQIAPGVSVVDTGGEFRG